jgi:hypothetical protein
MTTDNFCFYWQNRLIQNSQTGGQRYSDTSLFSIPWIKKWKTLTFWKMSFLWLCPDAWKIKYKDFLFQISCLRARVHHSATSYDNVITLFYPSLTLRQNKLECLSLPGFSSKLNIWGDSGANLSGVSYRYSTLGLRTQSFFQREPTVGSWLIQS